jgi:hypothetical protein
MAAGVKETEEKQEKQRNKSGVTSPHSIKETDLGNTASWVLGE